MGAATLAVACSGASPAPAPARAPQASVAASSPAGAGTEDAEARAGLEVAVERPRYLATQRRVEVVLRNAGESTVEVVALQLDVPAFEPVPATRRDASVAPGQRVDVPIDYGAVRCDHASTRGGGSLVLTLLGARGGTTDARADLPAAPRVVTSPVRRCR